MAGITRVLLGFLLWAGGCDGRSEEALQAKSVDVSKVTERKESLRPVDDDGNKSPEGRSEHTKNTILPAEIVRADLGDHSPYGSDFWTPNVKDVEGIAVLVMKRFRTSHDPRERRVATKILGYSGQFYGVTRKKKRLVDGTLACEVDEEKWGWRKRVFFVKDGGECFVGVVYDPENRKVVSATVHGDA